MSNSTPENKDLMSNSTSENEDLMNSEGEDKNTETGENWSELPSLSIEKIYSFLSRTDQYRMSLVCRKWAKDYSSPSLWKTVKFYLPEHEYSSEIYPEIRFARKYGCMFRHVQIICKEVRPRLLGVIRKQLKFFLQALASESQLMSIKLIHMGGYFSHLDGVNRQDVIGAFGNFFRTQKNLRVINFYYSGFTREEGVELLKVLSESNTLKAISLRGYFNHWVYRVSSNESITDLSAIFDMILNIETVEMDYSPVFEDTMRLCQEDYGANTPAFHNDGNQKRRCLSNLKIYYQGIISYQSEFKGIPQSCWKAVNKICPNLTVDLDVTIKDNARNEIQRFIVRSMRIKTLNILYYSDSSSRTRTAISVLFNHLLNCRANDHLELVNIDWKSTISDLAVAVVPFLRACSKLRHFQLTAKRFDNSYEDVLKSLLEHRPSCLKSIIMWYDKLSYYKKHQLLHEYYYQLLQVIGIYFNRIAEDFRSI